MPMQTPVPTTETTPQPQQRSVGTVVVAKLDLILSEIAVLREFADLLGRRTPDGTNFLDRIANLLSMLCAGTEITHDSLKALHASLTDPRFQAAMREAFRGD